MSGRGLTQDAVDEAKDFAAFKGFTVIEPDPCRLLLDLDTEADLATFDHVCGCGLCTAKVEVQGCLTCGGKNVGIVGTARVNRLLLAPVLERLDGDTVLVTVSEPGRVELHGETRGALVMGLSPNADYKAPEAVMPPPGDTVRSDREATP